MEFFYFVFGAMFGSVANALIYRLPRNISWAKGHSICPHCKHQLKALDLIPLLSFLGLRGVCRYCKKNIGWRYFLVELFLAVGFVLLVGNPLLCGILWLTVVIAVMDWETKLVSELMVGLWGVLVILFRVTHMGFDLQSMIIGLVVGVCVIGGIWAFSKGKAMGFGDVEIAVVMGLWLGWPNVTIALWVAFVSGAVVGVLMLIKKRTHTNLKTEIAFGPFLVFGSWFAYLFATSVLRYLYV